MQAKSRPDSVVERTCTCVPIGIIPVASMAIERTAYAPARASVRYLAFFVHAYCRAAE